MTPGVDARVHHALGTGALEWIEQAAGLDAPLSLELVAGGRSNLTFVVSDAAGRRVVARRPPLGMLLPRAHDVAREHRVLSALIDTDVPVPRPLAMCSDAEVVGVPFYVMSYVDGVVLKNAPAAEGLDPAGRGAIVDDMVDVLAALHRLDPGDVGLSDLGKHDGYAERVLSRWLRQIWASTSGAPAELVRLHDDLLRRAPTGYRPRIVHGDYRLENCLVDAARCRVAAVLDWELCTLGDPLADIGYWLMYWGEPFGADAAAAFPDLPSRLPGFPTRQQILARYEALTDCDVSTVAYYWALAHWKLACILHGARERYATGDMLGSPEEAEALARRSRAMVSVAGAAFDAARTGELR